MKKYQIIEVLEAIRILDDDDDEVKKYFIFLAACVRTFSHLANKWNCRQKLNHRDLIRGDTRCGQLKLPQVYHLAQGILSVCKTCQRSFIQKMFEQCKDITLGHLVSFFRYTYHSSAFLVNQVNALQL